jgi:hypothetical protein
MSLSNLSWLNFRVNYEDMAEVVTAIDLPEGTPILSELLLKGRDFAIQQFPRSIF